MRILEINIPNEGSGYFPMYLQVIEVPNDYQVAFDPVWGLPMLQEHYWEMVTDLFNDEDKHQVAVIQIDRYTPEMVDKGRAFIMGFAGEVDQNIDDDESLASIYVHKMICDMYCCAGIFSWRW